jgi:hypothetical protein
MSKNSITKQIFAMGGGGFSIVSSRPHAQAYRLEKVGETINEIPLQPTYLGKI